MSKRRHSIKLLLATIASCTLACGDDPGNISVTPPEPEEECIREIEPVTYEVYFVIDVSGSMEPFLRSVRDELVGFAEGFPARNAQDREVRVDYYLIGFVNDVRVYGDGRMTSVIALQAAFDEAITDGRDNFNLNTMTFNAEEEENMLDAMAEAISLNPSAEARLIMVATDAPFVEAPAVLNEDIQVQNTYAGIREQLEQLEVRVHGFGKEGLGGLFINYNEMPPLTELPGSSKHKLGDLQGSGTSIRNTLFSIAQEAACN